MAVTFSLSGSVELPNAQRLVHGTGTFDALYATGGETCDLSTYFSGSPTIFVAGDDGYVAQSDRGTAAANKILLYEAGADAAALDEVALNTNCAAVVCNILAIGTAV